MEPEEIAQTEGLHGDWQIKPREWRATHDQQGKAIRWITKPVQGDMQEDDTILAEFKHQMAVVLRGAEDIHNLKFKPAVMIKNFDPKTRKRFKGISSTIFKKGNKEMERVERDTDANMGEKVIW